MKTLSFLEQIVMRHKGEVVEVVEVVSVVFLEQRVQVGSLF